jgi:arabinogalactan endo-1,4-beta-galactosidase
MKQSKISGFFLLGGLALSLLSCGNVNSSGVSSSQGTSSSPTTSRTPGADGFGDLHVNPPKTALASDFAYGVDASTLAMVEDCGGKFYNPSGSQQDAFEILADGGANYARFRLWNDPFDGKGTSYGGGTNDIKTDIALAKRAQNAGMKILVDFHYSDSWADPSKYYAPKAWKAMSVAEKATALGTFTSDSLTAFKEAGVTVDSVQLGNEINPGIAGVSSSSYLNLSSLISSGIKAAKSVFPAIKTIVHYTNITSSAKVYKYIGYLQTYGALPDVIGFSYYPYWHGSLSNLQEVLNYVSSTYNVDVMVMETAWGFTDDATDYSSNQFSSTGFGLTGGYATSPQAQATELADIVNVLAEVPNQKGKGVFYWEPAWLPVQGAGWISKPGYYYNDHGTDWTSTSMSASDLDALYSDSGCKNSWANQAWFDYNGKVLGSCYTYRHIKAGDKGLTEAVEGLVSSTMKVTLNLSDSTSTLPTSVQAVTNLGAYRSLDVSWNADDVAKITGPGYYTVNGTAGGFAIVCSVTAEKNYILDYSFEEQGCTNQSAVKSPWAVTTTNLYSSYGDAHIEANAEGNRTGTQYFHWYSTKALSFSLTQTLQQVPAGAYNFGWYQLTSYYAGGSGAAATSLGNLWYQIGSGDKVTVDILSSFTGWASGKLVDTMANPHQDGIVLSSASDVTIGFDCEAGAAAWGHADDFYFSAVIS